MSFSVVEATDVLLARLTAQWEADTPAINGGTAPALVFEPLEKDMKPHPLDTGLNWARVTVRHQTGTAAALGKHRFRRTGTLFVQVFVAYEDGSAYTLAQQLASVAQKAFEGTQMPRVSVKSAALAEKGVDGSWYRVDCTVAFWWDEIR